MSSYNAKYWLEIAVLVLPTRFFLLLLDLNNISAFNWAPQWPSASVIFPVTVFKDLNQKKHNHFYIWSPPWQMLHMWQTNDEPINPIIFSSSLIYLQPYKSASFGRWAICANPFSVSVH